MAGESTLYSLGGATIGGLFGFLGSLAIRSGSRTQALVEAAAEERRDLLARMEAYLDRLTADLERANERADLLEDEFEDAKRTIEQHRAEIAALADKVRLCEQDRAILERVVDEFGSSIRGEDRARLDGTDHPLEE